jgi:hypothetical protein
LKEHTHVLPTPGYNKVKEIIVKIIKNYIIKKEIEILFNLGRHRTPIVWHTLLIPA